MSKPTIERPAEVTEKMLVYLDRLRDSGETNMFGARPYVARKFGLDEEAAGRVLSYWMKTFSERHPR
jgi:hypothetical protein